MEERAGIVGQWLRVRDDQHVAVGDLRLDEALLRGRERAQRQLAQLLVPAPAQVLVHQQQHLEPVRLRERLRLGPEQDKLEAPATAVRGDESVDALRVRRQLGAFVRWQQRHGGLRDLAEAVEAVRAVERERRLAQQLGEPAFGARRCSSSWKSRSRATR